MRFKLRKVKIRTSTPGLDGTAAEVIPRREHRPVGLGQEGAGFVLRVDGDGHGRGLHATRDVELRGSEGDTERHLRFSSAQRCSSR